MENGVGYFLVYLAARIQDYLHGMPGIDLMWLGIGLVGQSLFMMRFIVQWIYSERHKQSLIPISFWYFSLVGGVTVLAYGVHKADPVIILGQLPGTIVYLRNLILIWRSRQSMPSTTP